MRTGLVATTVFIILLVVIFVFERDSKTVVSVTGVVDNMAASEIHGKGVVLDRHGNNLLEGAIHPAFITLIEALATTSMSHSQTVQTTLDRELQITIYNALLQIANEAEYQGGAGIVMDIETGALLALTSYTATKDAVSPQNNAINGLYAPGSIIKPFIALAALEEEVITLDTKINSPGYIYLPDQNQPTGYATFGDWRRHGLVNLREAIGLSSNVYFYSVGGGFEDQEGLGIERIDSYLTLFGFGQPTGISGLSESMGQIPTPAWKREVYDDEWRTADTYLVSIGQHGYEMTPLQIVRAVASIASDGTLVTPYVFATSAPVSAKKSLPIKDEHFTVVKQGMEYAVYEGTAVGLRLDNASIAAKTGTAEVDDNETYIHSWVTGYFPREHPKYAFVIMLENGPWGEEKGAVAAARTVFVWMSEERQQYVTEE